VIKGPGQQLSHRRAWGDDITGKHPRAPLLGADLGDAQRQSLLQCLLQSSTDMGDTCRDFAIASRADQVCAPICSGVLLPPQEGCAGGAKSKGSDSSGSGANEAGFCATAAPWGCCSRSQA
jgi:hypothetical protein